jgi:hypothetical protein
MKDEDPSSGWDFLGGRLTMTATRWILFGLAVAVGISISAEASAQQPGKRSISRPTLSPYLNQYRTELGIRDPYSLMTRPSPMATPRTRSPMTTTYGSQLESTMPRSPEVMRNRDRMLQEKAQRMIAPTGVGAGYMNTSHFYSFGSGRR